MVHAEAQCCFLGEFVNLSEILGKFKHEPKQAICMEVTWVGLRVGWNGVSTNHQGQGTVLIRLMETQMVPACLQCGGRV